MKFRRIRALSSKLEGEMNKLFRFHFLPFRVRPTFYRLHRGPLLRKRLPRLFITPSRFPFFSIFRFSRLRLATESGWRALGAPSRQISFRRPTRRPSPSRHQITIRVLLRQAVDRLAESQIRLRDENVRESLTKK